MKNTSTSLQKENKKIFLGMLLSWYLFYKTLKEFKPSTEKSSMFYAGLVSLCLSIPIKIKDIICEKEVAHEIEKPSEVWEVFRPFYHTIRLYDSPKSPRKTSIEDAFKDMYKLGMMFTLFGMFGQPLSYLISIVILVFVMYFIYRCQAIYIYHWLVKQKYVKLTNLTADQRYIYPSWHKQK